MPLACAQQLGNVCFSSGARFDACQVLQCTVIRVTRTLTNRCRCESCNQTPLLFYEAAFIVIGWLRSLDVEWLLYITSAACSLRSRLHQPQWRIAGCGRLLAATGSAVWGETIMLVTSWVLCGCFNKAVNQATLMHGKSIHTTPVRTVVCRDRL